MFRRPITALVLTILGAATATAGTTAQAARTAAVPEPGRLTIERIFGDPAHPLGGRLEHRVWRPKHESWLVIRSEGDDIAEWMLPDFNNTQFNAIADDVVRWFFCVGDPVGVAAMAEQVEIQLKLIHQLTLEGIFSSMAVRLDPVKSADVNTVAGFRFPDTGQAFTVHVRRGVAEIQPSFPENPDLTVSVVFTTWTEIAAGIRSPGKAGASPHT